MKVELDHVFVMCAAGGPEADLLVRAGLTEGPGNRHPGQGTSCRRFFFARQYLELLWVCDAAEAQGPLAQRTRLYDRWFGRHRGTCPFGLVLRPAEDGDVEAPFPTWAYHPAYLPAGLVIEIAKQTPLTEPEFFFLGFQRPGVRVGEVPTKHELPVTDITDLRLETPLSALQSPAGRWATSAGLLSTVTASAYALHVTFDHGISGGLVDLRPDLPFAMCW